MNTHADPGLSPGDQGYQAQLERVGYNATAIHVDTYSVKNVNFYNGKGIFTVMYKY